MTTKRTLALVIATAACTASPPPTPPAPPSAPRALDAPVIDVPEIDAVAPATLYFEITLDHFGPIDASTPLDLATLRDRLPAFTVDEVVRDSGWARYRAFAVKGEGKVFDVIPGERGQRLVELYDWNRVQPDPLRESLNEQDRCWRPERFPGRVHCNTALANLRSVASNAWNQHELGGDAMFDAALWWPISGDAPETFTPLVVPGLAPARVVALSAPGALARAVGKTGVVVVRSVGEDEQARDQIQHACNARQAIAALGAAQSDLLPAVHAALAFFPLGYEPAPGEAPQPAGVRCVNASCFVTATSEGDPTFELRFADATSTGSLTAVIERDDWQSPHEFRTALDAKIAQAVAKHRCH